MSLPETWLWTFWERPKLSIPKVERKTECPPFSFEDPNHVTVFFQNVYENKFFVHLAIRREI